MDNRPIGVFDSGVGGLTVVKQVMKILPHEDIVYFGDTARVPYGSKSKTAVTRFSMQIVRFLQTKDVKAIIVACNTVSSNSLDILQKEFSLPLFGVVRPGVDEAIRSTKNKKVGIIGTLGTIRSNAYKEYIKKADPSIEVFSMPCPLFVPLAEEGWTENAVARLTAEQYLRSLVLDGIDSLVLGCTHYPLLKRCIGETVGEGIHLVDPAKATAKQVLNFLENHHLLSENQNEGQRDFYVSDISDQFAILSQKALKHSYVPIAIDIEKY